MARDTPDRSTVNVYTHTSNVTNIFCRDLYNLATVLTRDVRETGSHKTELNAGIDFYGKVHLEQATKAQSGSRGTALLLL